MTTNQWNDDGEIKQNHDTGPGWFLKIAYVVIVAFCLYYLFTYWNWQSNYQEQQTQIQQKIGGK
jgi:hypothetical protein